MVRSLSIFAFATTLLFTTPSSAVAADCRVSNAGIALHATQTLPRGVICSSGVDSLDCAMNTQADLGETYRVLVVVVNAGLPPRRVEVGIDYDGAENEGVDIMTWNSCSDLSTPENNWPEPGGGHVFQYYECQEPREGPIDLVLGWFQVYAHSPDRLELTDLGYREDRFPRLTECDRTESILDPLRLGYVQFGGSSGFNPCTDYVDVFPAACCQPDSCVDLQYYICCELAGGQLLPSWETCEDCAPTFAVPTTWGRIKSTYEN